MIQSAEFVISSTDYNKCPVPDLPEYAFIGRSNVGKSSLINMLTNRKELAHTSSKPGKTQLINHFLIDQQWYIVDLPGYGYASVSKDKKSDFERMISNYLLKRPNLMCVFVLLDSRLALQKIDAEFMQWLGEKEIPFVMVFTKADKLSKTQLENNFDAYKQEMLKSWEEMPAYFITSAEKKKGADELIGFMQENNPLFKKPPSPTK